MTEQVHHPAHYGGEDNPYEVIKVCRAWLTPEEYIGALKFQVWKYTARAGKKGNAATCMAKAKFYQDELTRFVNEQEAKNVAITTKPGIFFGSKT